MNARRLRQILTCTLLLTLAAGATLAKDKDKEKDKPSTPKPPKIKGPLVPVNLTEYAIEMPAALKHGWITLNITNKGEVPHAVSAQDGKKTCVLTSELAPGKTVLVPIKLRKGTFMVYCATREHAQAGMQAVAYVQ